MCLRRRPFTLVLRRSPALRTAIAGLLLIAFAGIAAAQATTTCSEPLTTVFQTSSTYSFDSVEVISRDDVWVTGESESTYFGHWDGESWTAVRGPEPSPGQYDMVAVSGTASNNVWAVGKKGFNRPRSVILHWNGSRWSVFDHPVVGVEALLLDVLALEDGTAYAVGAFRRRNVSGVRPLVFRFDGSAWTRESLGHLRFGITDIDGHSSDNLWAVVPGRPFVLNRTANGWARVPFPRSEAGLRDVAVSPEGSAWFVGEGGSSYRPPLVMRYTAGSWKRFDVPDRRYSEYLYAVDALSDARVWIVGLRITGDHAYPYAARMTDAGFFRYVPAEDPGWLAFWDIDVDETGGAWAVGETSIGGIVERAC